MSAAESADFGMVKCVTMLLDYLSIKVDKSSAGLRKKIEKGSVTNDTSYAT